MPFPRIHVTETCPLEGYEGYTLRILANPTPANKNDWAFGDLPREGCEDCARLGTLRGKPKATQAQPHYCAECTAKQQRLARACVAILGETRAGGLDFSTEEAAIATLAQPAMPDDLLAWIYMVPAAVWERRSNDLKKKLTSPSANANGSPS